MNPRKYMQDNAEVATALRLPIIEIFGDKRVLIENHKGICSYGSQEITVNVSFGKLCVSGTQLCIRYMTKCRLVICGQIHGVTVNRGDR